MCKETGILKKDEESTSGSQSLLDAIEETAWYLEQMIKDPEAKHAAQAVLSMCRYKVDVRDVSLIQRIAMLRDCGMSLR